MGRQPETRHLSELVADSAPTAAARIIEGRPGTGKTALFEFALREATAARLRLLRASPAEAEAVLPYAALGDLLESIPDGLLDALPAAQGVVLRAALTGAGVGAGVEPDEQEPYAVARATLGLLRSMTAQGPLLVAIDDAQWLDPPSSRALLFAIRRLADERLRLLVTRRLGEADDWRETIARALPGDRFEQLRLGALEVDDVAALLDTRLGLRLPRPAVVEVHRRSEGNPLFALEIGRVMLRRGDAGDVPEDLGALLRTRLGALPAQSRMTVLGASLASHPTRSLLVALAGDDALADAVDAEVLSAEGERVRLSHPLLASVAGSMATGEERANVHLALAGLVEDTEESALHLALGTTEPSESIAAGLAGAADRAVSRGAPEIGARLAEHAARLTPPEDATARRRREVLCADLLLAAGDPQRARAILERLVLELDAGAERADVLWRLGDAVGDDLRKSTELSEQALREAGEDDLALKTQIRLALGTFTWLSGDLAQSAAHVREAARLAGQIGDDQLHAVSLAEVMHADAVLGYPEDAQLIETALAIEQRIATFPPGARPSFQLAIVYVYTDRLDEARPLLDAELKRVEASGDESARVAVLFRIAELELRAGNWSRALRAAKESASLASQAGIEQEQCVANTALALVLVHLGRTEDARPLLDGSLQIAESSGDMMSVLRARGALGFMALSRGDHAGAIEWLAPAMAEIEARGIGELSIYGVVQNLIDALIAAQRFDDALHVIELAERKAARTRRAWHLAVANRGRALIAAARGEEEEALGYAATAMAENERLPQPFELGRTLLARGTIERRFRRRAAARETLTRALEVFDSLGAALWAELAAAQLARISGRQAAGSALTETEERVAELVALGLSNAEIAARMFVAVRTVEAHLSRTFSKLGVRSRVDLARWAAERTKPDTS